MTIQGPFLATEGANDTCASSFKRYVSSFRAASSVQNSTFTKLEKACTQQSQYREYSRVRSSMCSKRGEIISKMFNIDLSGECFTQQAVFYNLAQQLHFTRKKLTTNLSASSTGDAADVADAMSTDSVNEGGSLHNAEGVDNDLYCYLVCGFQTRCSIRTAQHNFVPTALALCITSMLAVWRVLLLLLIMDGAATGSISTFTAPSRMRWVSLVQSSVMFPHYYIQYTHLSWHLLVYRVHALICSSNRGFTRENSHVKAASCEKRVGVYVKAWKMRCGTCTIAQRNKQPSIYNLDLENPTENTFTRKTVQCCSSSTDPRSIFSATRRPSGLYNFRNCSTSLDFC